MSENAYCGFWEFAVQQPSHLSVMTADGSASSAGQLLGSINQTSRLFQRLGIAPGARIALLCDMRTEYLQIYLAAMQSGLYLIPLNRYWTASEIAYVLNDATVSLFIASSSYSEIAKQAAKEAGIGPESCQAIGQIAGFKGLADLAAVESADVPAQRLAGAPILYTSGTTGRPKGILRPLPRSTPEEIGAREMVRAAWFGFRPSQEDTHLVTAPLYHGASIAWALRALHLGNRLVLMNHFDAELCLDLIERFRVTTAYMVPTMMHRLLEVPAQQRSRRNLSSMRSIVHAGAACPVPLKNRFMEAFGPIVWEYYSSSEGGGTIVSPQDWLARPGTVGRPWPGAQIQVLDDEGNVCPPGTQGAIYIGGDQVSKWQYLNDREKTTAAWRGEFVTAGDIGWLDADGWLYISDRRTDLIVSGGVNVYPAEVEAVLIAHPAVADAAVVGQADEEWGQKVVAVVQLTEAKGANAKTAKTLLEYCSTRLAAYKCPTSIDFMKSLPRDEQGKMRRRLVREMLAANRRP